MYLPLEDRTGRVKMFTVTEIGYLDNNIDFVMPFMFLYPTIEAAKAACVKSMVENNMADVPIFWEDEKDGRIVGRTYEDDDEKKCLLSEFLITEMENA